MTLLRGAEVRARRETDGVSTLRSVALLCVGVVALRAFYVLHPLRSDEGGYLLIARQWHSGGEFLYGDYHVDRPPLLLAIFRLAAATEWDPAIRVLTIPFAVLFVVAAARAAHLVAGRRAAPWAALVAAALVSSPALAADQADGELFAVPFVMGSVALVLDARRRLPGHAQLWLAFAAGVLASGASLVKQNFLEGFVFAGVLVAADVYRRRGVGTGTKIVATGLAIGALVPYAGVAVWARAAGFDGTQVWSDLVTFRGDAFSVIWQRPDASIERGLTLLVLALASGLILVLATWVLALRDPVLRNTPETWAIAGTLAFGLAGIVAGGSYWLHYLLELAPMAALAAGVVAATGVGAGLWMRRWSRFSAFSALAACLVIGLVYATVPWPSNQQRVGEWLAGSSVDGDTAVVAYGNASVLETADLQSPYPYLWSLPMRTLDPAQRRLRTTLAGPQAPAWVVEMTGFNAWGIDDDYRLREIIDARYRMVETVCGNDMWLRADLSRQLASLPRC